MAQRTFLVSHREAGNTLLRFLRLKFAISLERAHALFQAHQVTVDGRAVRTVAWRLRAGQRVVIEPRPGASAPAEQPIVRFMDSHVVVVDKPAGLTTVRHEFERRQQGARAERYLPRTLADMLPGLLPARSGRCRAVHRLDRDTSGLVVFARTAEAASQLGRQFRRHTIERRYIAIVRGRAQSGHIESCLVRDRGDGRRGSASAPPEGQLAVTDVIVREHFGAYSLLEASLQTGRTHQVRIHLGEAGTPLCGERVYDRDLQGRIIAPDDSDFPRPALHASVLAFDHPASARRCRWTSPLPADLQGLLRRLRHRQAPSAR